MAGRGHPGEMGDMPMPPPSSPSSATPMATVMHMTFFWGKDVQVLFSGWPGSRRGVQAYLLALFFVFALALLVESLSYAADRLASPSRGGGAQPSSSSSSSSSISAGLAQTAVHAIRVGLAYLVMLAVMSFNVGVLLAAVAGHAIGFLLLGSGAFRRAAYDGLDVEDKR